MDVLLLPPDRLHLFCEQAAAQSGLVASSVEKDFWVTWMLGELFALPGLGQTLTFKGGTSLSKVWKLIERFSEDIDVVIDRDTLGFGGENAPEHAPSNKQRRARLDALRAAAQGFVRTQLFPALHAVLARDIPAGLAWSLQPDPEDPDQQTLLFTYPTVFPEGVSYLRQLVKIELGARSDTDPCEDAEIQPLLSELFTDLFPNSRTQVRAVRPERTFWEKAMLLHEEAYRPEDRSRRKKYMARHYYDLFRLIQLGVADRAAADLELFHRIAEHRKVYFRYSWMDYATLQPETLRLLPDPRHLADWKADYEGMQQEMFTGEVPAFQVIMNAVADFESRLRTPEKGEGL